MGWIGRKGESDKVKRTVRLHRIWDSMIREYSRRTGLNQREVMEKLLSYGNESFRREYGLGEENDRGKKQEKDEAINLAGRQLRVHAQNTSCDRFTREVIFGDVDLKRGTLKDEDLMLLSPMSIWDRLFGRRKGIEWQPV